MPYIAIPVSIEFDDLELVCFSPDFDDSDIIALFEGLYIDGNFMHLLEF